MKALVWYGKEDIRCETIPDPSIEDPRDALVKVTTCAICGSDLHLYDHYIPGTEDGDVIGHEFMGEVVEVGSQCRHLTVGEQAVVQCDVQPTDTVAIWGCGPVGKMAIRSAILLGAKEVIAIDRVVERLVMAVAGGATTIHFEEESVIERLNELTDGKGPGKCVDAVGVEAHATGLIDAIYDKVKQRRMLESDRPHVLREMMYVCRPAGVLSVPGVCCGLIDKVPFGMVMNKGLTIRTEQTHVRRWTDDLLKRVEMGQVDPSFVLTHTSSLEQGPQMYKTFREKQDGGTSGSTGSSSSTGAGTGTGGAGIGSGGGSATGNGSGTTGGAGLGNAGTGENRNDSVPDALLGR